MMENNLTNPAKSKTCPRCGKVFECLHSADCWCAEYAISPEAFRQMQENYNNCLCPECLPLFGERKSDRIAQK